MWYFIVIQAGENSVTSIAESLGLSAERVRHYLQRGKRAFREGSDDYLSDRESYEFGRESSGE